MSNVLTFFAKGNVPLSISLTSVTTVGSLLTTPLVLGVLSASHLPGEIDMPVGRISYEISLCLLGPLLLGMIIGNAIDAHREVFARWAIRASLGAIALIIVGAASAERIDPLSHGASVVAAIVLFTLLACAVGFGLCAAAGLDSAARTAVAIEASFRNTSLALMVKALVFPVVPGVVDPLADGVFYVALLYGGVAFQVALVPLVWHRRRVRLSGAA